MDKLESIITIRNDLMSALDKGVFIRESWEQLRDAAKAADCTAIADQVQRYITQYGRIEEMPY